MPERLLPEQQNPKEIRSERSPVGALLVAAGVAKEHAGKRQIGSTEHVLSALSERKPEDLADHHQAIADFAQAARGAFWAGKETPLHPEEQLANWREGVYRELQNLEDANPWLTPIMSDILGRQGASQDNPDEYKKQTLDGIEHFRQTYLVGIPKIEAFAHDFVQDRPYEDTLSDLRAIEPFLGIFGGKDVAALLVDAVAGQAFLQDLQDRTQKDKLLDHAREVLASDIPDETAQLYAKLHNVPVEMQKGEEVELPIQDEAATGTAEPAPVEPAKVVPVLEKDVQVSSENKTAPVESSVVVPVVEKPEETPVFPVDNEMVSSEKLAEEPAKGEDFPGKPVPKVEKTISYKDFLQKTLDRELEAFPELRAWVNERINALPEMDVTIAPLTNDKWKAEMGKDEAEVEKIVGAFFAIEGRHVAIAGSSAAWDQPSIEQSTAQIAIPTPEGILATDVSGMVGVIRDKEGNVLLSMAQEPLSDTPKHALIRTPLQTSAAKFNALRAGDTTKDPALMKLLETMYGAEDPFGAFLAHLASGEATAWVLGPADANRIHAKNIGIGIEVDDEAVRQALLMDGKNRWVTPEEFESLKLIGLVNGHTIAAMPKAKPQGAQV